MAQNNKFEVHAASGKIRYSDRGTAKKLFKLPKGAIVLRIYADIKTAFNGSGTDLLDVGVAADTDRFVNDLTLATGGLVAATLLNGGRQTDLTGPVIEVVGTYTDQNSDATAGEAEIICEYADPFNH